MRIYLIFFLIFAFGCSKPIKTNINLNIKKSEIQSIYLKIPTISKDSVRLKPEDENYFINEWQKKEFVGYWKGFPEYQIILNYKSGISKKLRINAKDKEVFKDEFIYELKDYGFFEIIWKNKFHPNIPSTIEKLGIEF